MATNSRNQAGVEFDNYIYQQKARRTRALSNASSVTIPLELDRDEEQQEGDCDLLGAEDFAHSAILPDDNDDDDDDCIIIEEEGNADVLYAKEVIDLTIEDSEQRNQPQRPGETTLRSVLTPDGTSIKPKNFIKVANTFLGELEISFVYVTAIIRDRYGTTLIRGVPYAKLGNLNGKIAKRPNEVCMVLHVHKYSNIGDPSTPSLIDVEPGCVKQWHTLITTNAPYPVYAVDPTRRRLLAEKRPGQQVSWAGNIVCRWKLTLVYSVNKGNRTKPDQELLEHFLSDDVSDSAYRVSDEDISRAWRGERKRGGAWNIQPHHQKPLQTPIVRHPDQAYTLFDSFCGGGGVSRGAQDAGFRVRHAIDKEPEV